MLPVAAGLVLVKTTVETGGPWRALVAPKASDACDEAAAVGAALLSLDDCAPAAVLAAVSGAMVVGADPADEAREDGDAGLAEARDGAALDAATLDAAALDVAALDGAALDAAAFADEAGALELTAPPPLAGASQFAVPPNLTVMPKPASGAWNPLSLWNLVASNGCPWSGSFKVETCLSWGCSHMMNEYWRLSPVSFNEPGAM